MKDVSERRQGWARRLIVAHLDEVSEDEVAVGLEDGEGNEEDELGGVVVGPEDFPEAENVVEGELAFEGDEDPSGKRCE